MALPTARGRVNGLHRRARNPIRRAVIQSAAHVHLVVLGTGLYSVALLFPLVLKQVTVAAFLAAFVGIAILILGLHLRWTRGRRL